MRNVFSQNSLRAIIGTAAAAAALTTGIVAGTGSASAAPAKSVSITSTFLGVEDPFPFGHETLTVTRLHPGVLKLTPSHLCPSGGGSCADDADLSNYYDVFRVNWINFATGRAGYIAVTSEPVTINTGGGTIGILGVLGVPGTPGVATIGA